MSNLSNEVPFPKDPVNNENPTSFRVMLFTILLLIAGLVMSGTMLLYYANTQRTDPAQTTADAGTSAQRDLSVRSFFNKLSSKTQDADSGTSNTNGNSGVLDQLFGGLNSSAVNWPKLKLTGFGSAVDGVGGFAIINEHQYRQGDLINGKVKLLEIRKHNVLMEYMGETNTLSMYITD
ncbi:general secretion pathway protein GspB [Pontiellaceae bacterium B1224]|nr:general secretion pathway protein GspB [Pontiellaceae bacterium B1224]